MFTALSTVKTQSFSTRVATAILRTPPRILPIPGWFPVVVQRLHPLVARDLEAAVVTTHGVRLQLDLNDYIQQRIFYESHEPAQLTFVERFLRPGDVVLDAGAHVGLFTLLAASIVGGKGHVHTFEPVPSNFEALEANVRLNEFTNVTLNRAALGAEAGTLELGLPEVVPDTGSTSAMYTVGGGGQRVSAPVMTLDAYVRERLPGQPIRLLKMDVEGFEQAVLEGFAERLTAAPPTGILLEVNVELLEQHGFRADEILRLLGEAGYSLYRTNAFGQLREFEEDRTAFVSGRSQSSRPTGLTGWIRRYREESQIFFNLFALQPDGGR